MGCLLRGQRAGAGEFSPWASALFFAFWGAFLAGMLVLYLFAFDDADTLPTAGTTYTLMSFAAQSGFSASDFSYSYSGAAPALNGEFVLTDGALLFHVTSLPVGLQSFTVD